MKNIELDFCFKGDRQYVHGTDMLNKCVDYLLEACGNRLENFQFVIHRMTDRNLIFTFHQISDCSERPEYIVAGVSFSVARQAWVGYLTDGLEQPVCRYPYDEDAVVDLCSVDKDGRRIKLTADAAFSDIETLVAMTKALHLKVFHDFTGKWVFSGWDSPRWPLGEGMQGVCIQLIQNLGTRLTKSEVTIAGKVLGHIYFSGKAEQ